MSKETLPPALWMCGKCMLFSACSMDCCKDRPTDRLRAVNQEQYGFTCAYCGHICGYDESITVTESWMKELSKTSSWLSPQEEWQT